jgi:hypothetical protein
MKGCERTEWDGGFLYVCHPVRASLRGLDDMGDDEPSLSEGVQALEYENGGLIAEVDSAHGLLDALGAPRQNAVGEAIHLYDRIEWLGRHVSATEQPTPRRGEPASVG